jgi:hypothetical protein
MSVETLAHMQAHGQLVADARPVTLSAEALANYPVGKKFARQGDLYFSQLLGVPSQCKPWPYSHGQLAPGSTQGSRHCVDISKVTLYILPFPTALDGPVIDAPNGVEITHPEHGNHIYPPGVYHVTFQRAHTDELRRVLD